MEQVQLHVFDPSFTYRGRVQNWINMTWTEEYRGEGKFTLTTYDTDQYAVLLRQGYFFYRADRPVAMMAVKVERNTDDNTITVCGYTTLHLLTRRIIDLPHEFVNIESGIYTMIQKDLRNLPGVVTAPVKGLTAEFKCNIEGVVLLDGVFEMLNESSYGIRANFDYANKRHVIEVYDGVDRTYDSQHGGTVFSQEFGNLKSLTVEEDDDLYKNVAYVTGSSDNDPATVYYQYISPEAGEQKNWREMLVNGENQESGESIEDWQERQKQTAIKALQGYKSALAFEVELSLGVFGEKYDLGDKVTCKSKRYGLQFDTQIMEYQYSYKQGVEKVKVVLGDRPLDYVQSSIAKSSGSGGGMKITGGGGSSGGTPGEPGEPGKDGVGIVSVVQTTTSTADGGENIITVTLTDGSANRFSVRNGSKGSPGATPVRGEDYWTAADKEEIVAEVVEEVGTGTGGFRMKVLWQNASTSSQFIGQTISFNTNGYALFAVYFRQTSGNANRTPMYLIMKNVATRIPGFDNSNGSTLRVRHITINNNGAVLDDAVNVQGTNSNVNHTCLIPEVIYGIEGVVE